MWFLYIKARVKGVCVCNNYMCVSLLSVDEKVYGSVLIEEKCVTRCAGWLGCVNHVFGNVRN